MLKRCTHLETAFLLLSISFSHHFYTVFGVKINRVLLVWDQCFDAPSQRQKSSKLPQIATKNRLLRVVYEQLHFHFRVALCYQKCTSEAALVASALRLFLGSFWGAFWLLFRCPEASENALESMPVFVCFLDCFWGYLGYLFWLWLGVPGQNFRFWSCFISG